MKKFFTAVIISAMTFFCALSVYAETMNIYISGQLEACDIENVGGFDMLPVQDIVGDLGFTCWYDGYNITLYGTNRTYYLHIGDAVVTDNADCWYGLDVTPREINGKVRVPAKFFCDVLGMNYTWDGVTKTLFLNSDYTYNWLINTKEYKNAVNGTTVSKSRSYECYEGTSLRTFTNAVGQPVTSLNKTSNGDIYEYGYTDVNLIYSYVAKLQNDGMTYIETEQRGTTIIVGFMDENNHAMILAYDGVTGFVKIMITTLGN